MNSPSRRYLRAGLFALMCCASFHVYGDEAKDSEKGPGNNLPILVQHWSPAFDKDYITVSITNNTDHPIRIFSAIDPKVVWSRGGKTETVPNTPDNSEPDLIVASVVFNATVGSGHGIEGAGFSGGIGSVQVAPGETKTVKLFDPEQSLHSMAEAANKVTFVLRLNGQDLGRKVVLIKSDDAWKAEP